MSTDWTRDAEVPLGDHWQQSRDRAQPEEETLTAEPLRTSPLSDQRQLRDDLEARKADRARQDEATRSEGSAAVDLYTVDAMYARSAANGMADSKGKHLAVEIAVDEAAERRAGRNRRPAPATRRDRARAAQRWEQNREYVESRHEHRDQRQ